jgi:hypothetical protein
MKILRVAREMAAGRRIAARAEASFCRAGVTSEWRAPFGLMIRMARRSERWKRKSTAGWRCFSLETRFQ